MTIGSNARILVGSSSDGNDNNGASRGYLRGNGPGYLRTAGGSFAGEGGHITNTTGFITYGSILDPLSYGSGGWGDQPFYSGGGIVKLDVGGALTVDGMIRSRGFGYALNNDYVGGAGSGGSINITAASLAGAGSIDANGGNNGLYGPGSGGRIKVALTGAGADFTGFAGTIEAVGGGMESLEAPVFYDISPAAAGTVCLQTAGADPVVKVHNVFRIAGTDSAWRVASGDAIPSATHLPAMQDGDSVVALQKTDWEISGRGALRLTRDARIQSLTLASDDGSQCIYTEGHTLTVKEMTVAGKSIHTGVHTAADMPGIIVGDGSVVVDFMPTILIVR